MLLDVRYEDNHLLVVNKPAGMVVHPALRGQSNTLVDVLRRHTSQLSDINGPLRPGIVHRLDKDTSGLLVVAKTNRAHDSLADQLRSHRLRREYIALVWGSVEPDTGKIDAPIGRHPSRRKQMAIRYIRGRHAITNYTVKERFTLKNLPVSLLIVHLETGRTHQIRVHLASIGYPLLGDKTYISYAPVKPGRYKQFLVLNRQALHSRKLSFLHPVENKLVEVRCPIPVDIKEQLSVLQFGYDRGIAGVGKE